MVGEVIRRMTQLAGVVLLAGMLTGCGGSPEQELQNLLDGDVETLTIRDCTCGDEAVTAASYSRRFEPWPDYKECLEQNRDTAAAIGDRAEQNRAFLLEYLDPRPDVPTRHYWHHNSRRGTFYHYTPCRDVPAGDPCGWQTQNFSHFAITTRGQQFPGCDGDGSIDSAAVTVGIDGEPARTLPEALLAETDDDD